MYDAETLSPLGEAKLLCGDIFQGTSTAPNMSNRHSPIFTDHDSGAICLVTCKITEKKKTVKPEMAGVHATYMKQQEKTRWVGIKEKGLLRDFEEDTPALLQRMLEKDLLAGKIGDLVGDQIEAVKKVLTEHYHGLKDYFYSLSYDTYPRVDSKKLKASLKDKAGVTEDKITQMLKDVENKKDKNLLQRYQFVQLFVKLALEQEGSITESITKLAEKLSHGIRRPFRFR